MEDTSNNLSIPSNKELEFALFCIDFVAKELDHSPKTVYRKLKESGLLQHYIIENYDVLHTLGREYLVSDIIRLMQERKLV